MSWNAHWPLITREHTRCSAPIPAASSHVTVTASRCPRLSPRGIVGVMHVPSGLAGGGAVDTSPESCENDSYERSREAWGSRFWILKDSCEEPLASTGGPSLSWLTSLPVTPLQPFSSPAFRGGLWVAMPWIYTWDLAIIHPRSFQIDGLLKVNCAG